MPNMVVKDSDGRSGGLAMLWKRGVNVSLRWKGKYHIDVDVVEENGIKWMLIGIYEESKSGEKDKTWKLLELYMCNFPQFWNVKNHKKLKLFDKERKV